MPFLITKGDVVPWNVREVLIIHSDSRSRSEVLATISKQNLGCDELLLSLPRISLEAEFPRERSPFTFDSTDFSPEHHIDSSNRPSRLPLQLLLNMLDLWFHIPNALFCSRNLTIDVPISSR